MTQKTKLKIIGPYTPDHEGPFCTRDGRPVRIVCRDKKTSVHDDCSIVALIDCGHAELARDFHRSGRFAITDHAFDLMNAREVPVAREFWVNEYAEMSGDGFWFNVFSDKSTAKRSKTDTCIRTIHVREVLPGEE